MKNVSSLSASFHAKTLSRSIIFTSTLSQLPTNIHKQLYPLCPDCLRCPFIQIIPTNSVEINCPCGYKKKITLKEYVNASSFPHYQNQSAMLDCTKHNNQSFKYYCSQCKINICYKCLPDHKEHKGLLKIKEFTISERKLQKKLTHAFNTLKILDSYKKIKNDMINDLVRQINSLETAYDECIKNNNIIVNIIEQLINSYNREKPNFFTISNLKANSEINLIKLPNVLKYDCKEAIQFFRSFSILNKTKGPLEFKEINHFKVDNLITSCLLIDDNHLAVCGEKNIIEIYNLKSNQIETILGGHQKSIWSLAILSQDKMVSCSSDKSIIIWNKNEKGEIIHNAHSNIILKVIALTGKRFASSSLDYLIKIWKDYKPYNLIATLKGHFDAIPSLLQLKDNKLVSCSGRNEMELRVWDLHNYKRLNTIENIHCSNINSMIELEDGRVVVGGENTLKIINTITYTIDLTFEDSRLGTILCILQIGNQLLIGNLKKEFFLFDLEKEKIYYTNVLMKYRTDYTNNIIRLGDGTLITSTYSGIITFWKV